MAMEMRQELKLSQQLVMTPQLQQAIRLLQLSRMELADLVHEEMLENPILDDELDLDMERSRERDEAGSDLEVQHQMEGAGSTETPIEGSVQDGVAQTEIKGDATAVNEIDWENYLDNYSMGPPMPAFRGDGEEMPSLDRLQKTLGGPAFEVVALSIDAGGVPVVERFYKEIGIASLAIYVDASLRAASQLATPGVPTTLLIDREGRELGRHAGPASWDDPGVVRMISSRLAR